MLVLADNPSNQKPIPVDNLIKDEDLKPKILKPNNLCFKMLILRLCFVLYFKSRKNYTKCKIFAQNLHNLLIPESNQENYEEPS